MMKNIYLFISAIALLLVSCDRKVEFKHETFATLSTVRYTVREDAGEFTVPVTIYNPTGDEVQLIVKTDDETAVQDVDYEIVTPANGVLTFSGDESQKDVVIKLNHNKAFQKSKTFYLSIAATDENFVIGNLNTATCVIKDAEHPLDMFIGEWKGTALSVFDGTSYPLTVNISEDESDETYTKLKVDGLEPMQLSSVTSLSGVVNAEKTQLTISGGQQIGYLDAYSSFFTFYPFAIAGENLNIGEALTITLKDGALSLDSVYGCLFTYTDGNEYVWDAYQISKPLTKK